MTLNKWSLDQLCMVVGTVALLILFLPGAIYLTHCVATSVNDRLLQQGQTLGNMLAAQLVEPILLDDRLVLRDALERAVVGHAEVRYICLINERGTVTSHTFRRGYPAELHELWASSGGATVQRFRAGPKLLMDVAVPIKDGHLGHVHVGVSRAAAARTTQRLLWMSGGLLTAALWVLMLGAGLLAARVCRPLHQLEEAVSRFPEPWDGDLQIKGTREVEALSRGFDHLSQRLTTLARQQAAGQERMIHAEKLATLGELAAGLAHEIHNPLDGMLECVRYLEADAEKSARAEKYYPLLRDGLERIARTMRQMLTFARSGQPMASEPYPVNRIVADLESMLLPKLHDRQVRLTWEAGGTCACLCNRDSLVQACLNLVLNAADAAEEGPQPHVRITLRCDAQWVYLAVDDNGPGVPEALRGKVFDAFFTTRPMGKGTGLGLSVSRQIIRALGGDIELSNQPSDLGGARFVIRLPREASDAITRQNSCS